jgi:hypothetical protein
MKRASRLGLLGVGLVAVTLSLVVAAGQRSPTSDPAIVLERVPNQGLQPQALADGRGGIHVVYFRGEPSAGDFYYVHRSPSGTYSAPIRVNSQSRNAIAAGTVRGAQIAASGDGTLHIIWNGSPSASPELQGGMPLFYTRRTGQSFEPQRNLLTSSVIDGGGTVVADGAGHVFVGWHAVPKGGREANGAVYVRRSNDNGVTFDAERRASDPALGACGCCSMRGLIDRDGALRLLFRAAGRDVDRDTTALVSRDLGDTFTASRLHAWRIGACPMSTFAMAATADGVISAWDTDRRVFVQRGNNPPLAVPAGSAPAKHPVLATNDRGELLAAWLEGTAWARGGSVAWQRYDRTGAALGSRSTADGVPAWGLAAAAPLADGRFLLLY